MLLTVKAFWGMTVGLCLQPACSVLQSFSMPDCFDAGHAGRTGQPRRSSSGEEQPATSHFKLAAKLHARAVMQEPPLSTRSSYRMDSIDAEPQSSAISSTQTGQTATNFLQLSKNADKLCLEFVARSQHDAVACMCMFHEEQRSLAVSICAYAAQFVLMALLPSSGKSRPNGKHAFMSAICFIKLARTSA